MFITLLVPSKQRCLFLIAFIHNINICLVEFWGERTILLLTEIVINLYPSRTKSFIPDCVQMYQDQFGKLILPMSFYMFGLNIWQPSVTTAWVYKTSCSHRMKLVVIDGIFIHIKIKVQHLNKALSYRGTFPFKLYPVFW